MENAMTHYMELLATNQPWNLLIFMAIPVICIIKHVIDVIDVKYKYQLDCIIP